MVTDQGSVNPAAAAVRGPVPYLDLPVQGIVKALDIVNAFLGKEWRRHGASAHRLSIRHEAGMYPGWVRVYAGGRAGGLICVTVPGKWHTDTVGYDFETDPETIADILRQSGADVFRLSGAVNFSRGTATIGYPGRDHAVKCYGLGLYDHRFNFDYLGDRLNLVSQQGIISALKHADRVLSVTDLTWNREYAWLTIGGRRAVLHAANHFEAIRHAVPLTFTDEPYDRDAEEKTYTIRRALIKALLRVHRACKPGIGCSVFYRSDGLMFSHTGPAGIHDVKVTASDWREPTNGRPPFDVYFDTSLPHYDFTLTRAQLTKIIEDADGYADNPETAGIRSRDVRRRWVTFEGCGDADAAGAAPMRATWGGRFGPVVGEFPTWGTRYAGWPGTGDGNEKLPEWPFRVDLSVAYLDRLKTSAAMGASFRFIVQHEWRAPVIVQVLQPSHGLGFRALTAAIMPSHEILSS